MSCATDSLSDLDVGTTVHLTAGITTNDDAVDTTVMTLDIKDPEGVVHHVPVTHEGLGQYSADYECLLAGTYFYRWMSDDPKSDKEGAWMVRASQFG